MNCLGYDRTGQFVHSSNQFIKETVWLSDPFFARDHSTEGRILGDLNVARDLQLDFYLAFRLIFYNRP